MFLQAAASVAWQERGAARMQYYHFLTSGFFLVLLCAGVRTLKRGNVPACGGAVQGMAPWHPESLFLAINNDI
jgi:hypothetical protein